MLLLLAGLLAGLVTMVILRALWRVYAPVLDDRLGFFTSRDFRRFLAHDVGGTSIGALVALRAGPMEWRASHRDFLFETDLDGVASDGTLYCWNISHRPPRPWLAQRHIYLTPTNRAAAFLIPELLPGDLTPRSLSEQACRPGAIYDLVYPEKAREWLEPHLRRMLPQCFRERVVRVGTRRGPTRA